MDNRMLEKKAHNQLSYKNNGLYFILKHN